MTNLRGAKCSKCGRKGLRYADHANAQGWKDYNRIECRFCGGRFDARKVEARIERERAALSAAGGDK